MITKSWYNWYILLFYESFYQFAINFSFYLYIKYKILFIKTIITRKFMWTFQIFITCISMLLKREELHIIIYK